jgi:hypothetical protein
MAGPRPSWLLPLVLSLGTVGCRGTPQPVIRSEPPAASKAPAVAPLPATPPSAPAPAAASQEATAPKGNQAVVVDPGVDGDGTPATLAEAARAEKERRSHAGQSTAVITDKTLPRYASKGQITVMDPAKDKKKGISLRSPAPAASAPAGVHDEAYWRSRGLEIRQRLRQTADDIKELEQKSTELRQKFYMENDLFVRDNRIKPDWDRVLDRLKQARLDEDSIKQELSDFIDEGGKAGALPGWLREGEEIEPAEPAAKAKKEELPPAQSIEPPILNDKPPIPGSQPDGGLRGER